MATTNNLQVIRTIINGFGLGQSQESLTSQANDCIPIIESMGYYDLADFLKKYFNVRQ